MRKRVEARGNQAPLATMRRPFKVKIYRGRIRPFASTRRVGRLDGEHLD